MAMKSLTGGRVLSVSRSGASYSAVVIHTVVNPDPPPPTLEDEITFQCSSSDHADFRAALVGRLVVDVEYDDAANTPTTVTLR